MDGVAAEAIGTCHNLHGTQAGMTGEKSRSSPNAKIDMKPAQRLQATLREQRLRTRKRAARIRLTTKTRPKGKRRSFRQEQAILETRAENQQRIDRNETCLKHDRLTASQKS